MAATASQPALRKLLYGVSSVGNGGSGSGGSGVSSVNSVSGIIQLLPQVRAVLQTLHSALPASTANRNRTPGTPAVEQGSVLGSVEESVNIVEHACLISLETLAQVRVLLIVYFTVLCLW